MSEFIITDKGVVQADLVVDIGHHADHSVYEVIRLMDGVPLFLEDHFERLLSSAHMTGIEFNMQLPELLQAIDELKYVNRQTIGNIKFLLSKTGVMMNWSMAFIPHSYPSDTNYQEGVPTGFLHAERNNPKAKVIQRLVREKADQLIAEKKLFEVLLVDRNGSVTEGSRSNVFFVRDGHFYTAPANMVLSGVTRKRVLECLSELNFPVTEKVVLFNEANQYEAVFLTGTSPKVLPVNAIDEFTFKTGHPLVRELMSHYDRKIDEYIQSRKD